MERPSGPLNISDCQKYVESTRHQKGRIPPELSFENVINNRCLPPASLQDFMDYLVYVSHDAENLQFYLWLLDYTKRYEKLKNTEKALSPEWKAAEAKALETRGADEKRIKVVNDTEVNFDNIRPLPSNQRHESIVPSTVTTSFSDVPEAVPSNDYESFITKSALSGKSNSEVAEEANRKAGLKWQPFTVQPFRAEVDKIIAHYIAPSSPRELNLSHRDRAAALHALQHTTHPSAFAILATMVETVLRGQAHPNFVRYSICNGNKPRVFFVRSMGWIHAIGGLLIAVLLTLSSLSRWYRIIAGVVFFIGLSTLIAAQKGLCVILHHSHHRGLRPWEDDDDTLADSELATARTAKSFKTEDTDSTMELNELKGGGHGSVKKSAWSLSTFGAANSFDDEPWIARYQRKSLLRRVFDKSVRVQEEGVRILQDRIVMQSNIWSLAITIIVVVVFVALPKGNFY